MSQEEIANRFKKANAQGFINHMVSAAGATAKEATELFKKSDAKADKLLEKKAAIRQSILDEMGQEDKSGLADNLKSAIS